MARPGNPGEGTSGNPFLNDPDLRFSPEPSRTQAEQEVRQLREAIVHHDRLYARGEPAISDAAYDALFRRLEALEERFGLATPESPTRRLAPVEGLAEAQHATPMLSLEAVRDAEAVRRWHAMLSRHGDAACTVEPKYDGVSVEVVYEDGRFVRGATRGDGVRGEDVTHNLRTVGNLPHRIQGAPAFLSLRGEVYLPRAAFHRLNRRRIEEGLEPFANPRNAAAGSLRRLDPRLVRRLPLRLVVYDVLAGDLGRRHHEALAQLERFRLPVGEHTFVRRVEDAEAEWHRIQERREELDYEADGIVVKADDLGLRERLGVRHRSPRWAIAWKFPPRQEVTRLVDIVVQVGRTGKLTPVALLEPVDVGGVTVSRATLHNEAQVRRLGVAIGDAVRIARAGDVIPEVVERVGGAEGPGFTMPGRCPACGARVVREGAHHVCPAGLACPAQAHARIVHYAGRGALDIEGLGARTVEALVQAGLVQDVADLYRLGSDDILRLERFGSRSAAQLVHHIQESKRPTLDRFLAGLGIPGVGARTARILAERFGLDEFTNADEAILQDVPGIGPETAAGVAAFFHDPRNQDVLRRLREAGVAPVGVRRGGRLAGKTIVLTGSLESLTRDEATKRIEDAGGHAATSVSARTDLVVAGKGAGSKLDAAKRRGVPIVDEAAFLRLLGLH